MNPELAAYCKESNARSIYLSKAKCFDGNKVESVSNDTVLDSPYKEAIREELSASKSLLQRMHDQTEQRDEVPADKKPTVESILGNSTRNNKIEIDESDKAEDPSQSTIQSYSTNNSQATCLKVTQVYKRLKGRDPMGDDGWLSNEHMFLPEDGEPFQLDLSQYSMSEKRSRSGLPPRASLLERMIEAHKMRILLIISESYRKFCLKCHASGLTDLPILHAKIEK